LIPEYLIGVQVQNYTLNSDGSELGGIAIGLVLDQNQEYINENGSTIRTTIEETELINSMKLKLPVIVEYFRSIPEFDDIEMVIGLYIVDNSNDLVPGSYIQYGHVGNNSNRVVSLSNYTIREALLPSSKAKAFDEEFHQKFIDFVDATKSSYEQNVGIIGRIRYTESKIEKVSISIKSSRNNKTFLLSLTQTVYNELINNFDDSYDVEVVISTYDKVEATITKSGNSNFVVTTYE
jgi:protein involved in sex pheromone biosynthesis